eukprot:12582048-Prorocentrum_lima.AAC.1
MRHKANKAPNSTGVMISGMDFLCLNTRDMKTMMIISAMEEVTSLIFNQPDEFVIFARASGVEYRGDEHQQGGTVP